AHRLGRPLVEVLRFLPRDGVDRACDDCFETRRKRAREDGRCRSSGPLGEPSHGAGNQSMSFYVAGRRGGNKRNRRHSLVDAVEAENLVKTYRSRSDAVEAVRGVDLRVTSGEVFGFMGPNGAGKSTTVRMLTTLLSLTSGTARVAGLNVAREPDAVRRRIGVALQEAGLDPRQTGGGLLGVQGRMVDPSARQAEARTGWLVQPVRLPGAAGWP